MTLRHDGLFFSPAGWCSAKFPSVHRGISTASSCTSLHFTAVGVSWWACCPNRMHPNGFVHGVHSCLCSHAYDALLKVPQACGSQRYLETWLFYKEAQKKRKNYTLVTLLDTLDGIIHSRRDSGLTGDEQKFQRTRLSWFNLLTFYSALYWNQRVPTGFRTVLSLLAVLWYLSVQVRPSPTHCNK